MSTVRASAVSLSRRARRGLLVGAVAIAASAVSAHAADDKPAAPSAPPPSSPVPATATMDQVNRASRDDHGVKDGVDPAILRAEVMLDRLHVSPGVIDGRDGTNFRRAVKTFAGMRKLRSASTLDAKVWDALTTESGGAVLVEHVLSDKDVAGPFFPDLPKDYAELAKLKTIGYHDVSEKLGAQFHMDEKLLASLNPGVDLSKPGTRILVAQVADQAPVKAALNRIVVDKTSSQVLGYDRKGRIVVAYPATIGSRELPSPSGTYKVKGIAFDPVYYYNPENFVQGDNKEKLKLPPGPNNPVGSVFIALTKPTYGLHGTPDPSKIDKTASHGCVRMTNWNARELAHLVRRRMVVHFKGR